MATTTAEPTNHHYYCQLCTNQYNKPVNLPNCGHIFCSACLISHTRDSIDNNENKNKLKCPSCSVNIDEPENVDTEAWINTLNKGMATANDKPREDQFVECAPCKNLGRSEKAVKYCFNCTECMCQQCLNICHTLKTMRHHEFTDIGQTCDQTDEDFNLLHKMSTLVTCSSHPNETIKFHCRDDDTFCCTICIVANHRKCSNVIELDKHVLEDEFKREMEHTNNSVVTVHEFETQTIQQLQFSIKARHQQADCIADSIAKARDKIIKVLVGLERNCNQTAKAVASRETLKMQQKIRRIESKMALIEIDTALMKKANKIGSASHQYIARIRCQEKYEKFTAYLVGMTKDFKSVNVSLKQEKLLEELLNVDQNDTDKLGSIVENPDKPLNSIYDANTKLEHCSFTKTGEVEVNENYPGGEPTYSSVVFLFNNQLVFLDSYSHYEHCLLASDDGTVLSSCDFVPNGASSNQKAYCTTVTKPDGIIAVSLPEQKKLCFVTTNGGQLKVMDKIIESKYKPGAICGLTNGDIAVAWREPVAFGKIDINTTRADTTDIVYFRQDKAGRSLKSFDNMAVDEERSNVIQPCRADNAVYCFDFNGNPKFKYTNPKLKYTRGVAVDKDGNIFVCDCWAHLIHVISPTGSASRLIKDGCPEKPLAIAFGSDRNTFVTKDSLAYRDVILFRIQRY